MGSPIYTLALGKALTDQLGTYLVIFGSFLPDTLDIHLINNWHYLPN